MLILNFSHPLTDPQRADLENRFGTGLEVRQLACQFDHARPFADQARELADAVGLSADQWQTERFVVVPPSLAVIAAALLAEIHGRAGYFSPVVRLRPVKDSVPPAYEVAEVLDLQGMRDAARGRRGA